MTQKNILNTVSLMTNIHIPPWTGQVLRPPWAVGTGSYGDSGVQQGDDLKQGLRKEAPPEGWEKQHLGREAKGLQRQQTRSATRRQHRPKEADTATSLRDDGPPTTIQACGQRRGGREGGRDSGEVRCDRISKRRPPITPWRSTWKETKYSLGSL